MARSITRYARIGMVRCTEHACHRAALHDVSEIHHRDTRAEPPHDTEIVTDEHEGQATPCLQFFDAGALGGAGVEADLCVRHPHDRDIPAGSREVRAARRRAFE